MYLITKWFGIFLIDNEKIIEKKLFSKNKKNLLSIIKKIENNKILEDEKEIVKGKKVIVNEKRLKKIGDYNPDDPFFNKIDLKSQDYGFSNDLINEISQELNKEKIQDQLSSEDLQLIQMVNALDDLIQTSNLLSERMESWNILPDSEKNILPIKNVQKSVLNEISFLEKEIELKMNLIAPNTASITGPLIGARLISLAGGINKLSIFPASTIQILGAEKALFRYKKEGGKPPKHGIIFQHPYINKAKRANRGKIARVLSNKIAIAIRADVYTKNDIAKSLKNDLKVRIKEIKN